MSDRAQSAAEQYEEGIEDFARSGTAGQQWLEGLQEFVLGQEETEEPEPPFEGEGVEEGFDPLGSLRDRFEAVGGFTEQDACDSTIADAVDIGFLAAQAKDAADILEEGGESGAANDMRGISEQLKQTSLNVLSVAEDIGCDVPSEVRTQISQL